VRHGQAGCLSFRIAFGKATYPEALFTQAFDGFMRERTVRAAAAGNNFPVFGQQVEHLLQLADRNIEGFRQVTSLKLICRTYIQQSKSARFQALQQVIS